MRSRSWEITLRMTEHIIKEIEPGSIAEEMEIEAGDILLSINDQDIEDVFDYRYLIKDEYVVVLIRKPNGEEWELEIEKEYEDDLGISFENDLMSDYKSCSNKCIFCFIDQMPPDMRETLYFKDDDSRLSFLQGNYITLTNMKEKDVERIIKMQLAPINISVQTTNPELRCKMLNNRFAGDKLKFLQMLYNGHVEMNGQIVCVKGVNDGAELERSIRDLSEYLPFMRSVSIVPAGITKYREGLFPIEIFTKEESEEIIDLIESFQQRFYEEYGLHFIHASDEWYITANRDFPEEERYDGYIQLENGVGMMRLLMSEFDEAMEELLCSDDYQERKEHIRRVLTIATGKLAYPTIRELADRLMEVFPYLQIQVLAIRNNFFGETITVSGLVTGRDLIEQMKEFKETCETGDTLLIPVNMLRMGERVFLDDLTIEDIEAELHMKLNPVEPGGKDFIEAVTRSSYHIEGGRDRFVYIQSYPDKASRDGEKS